MAVAGVLRFEFEPLSDRDVQRAVEVLKAVENDVDIIVRAQAVIVVAPTEAAIEAAVEDVGRVLQHAVGVEGLTYSIFDVALRPRPEVRGMPPRRRRRFVDGAFVAQPPQPLAGSTAAPQGQPTVGSTTASQSAHVPEPLADSTAVPQGQLAAGSTVASQSCPVAQPVAGSTAAPQPAGGSTATPQLQPVVGSVGSPPGLVAQVAGGSTAATQGLPAVGLSTASPSAPVAQPAVASTAAPQGQPADPLSPTSEVEPSIAMCAGDVPMPDTVATACTGVASASRPAEPSPPQEPHDAGRSVEHSPPPQPHTASRPAERLPPGSLHVPPDGNHTPSGAQSNAAGRLHRIPLASSRSSPALAQSPMHAGWVSAGSAAVSSSSPAQTGGVSAGSAAVSSTTPIRSTGFQQIGHMMWRAASNPQLVAPAGSAVASPSPSAISPVISAFSATLPRDHGLMAANAAFAAFKEFITNWLEWKPKVEPSECQGVWATTGTSPIGFVGIYVPGAGGTASTFLDFSAKECKQSRMMPFLQQSSWLTFRGYHGKWKTPVPGPFPSLLMRR